MKFNWSVRICLTLIAATSLITGVFGQLSNTRPVSTAVDHLIPPSPDVSALGKYTAIPVGLYTGTPQISIPVHELREGGMTVPVSLSYHAGGHKVDEIAPRTGMGWTLQAGGVISRTVFGQADEYSLDGFLKFSERNTPMDILAGPAAKQYELKNQLTTCADAEPDQFFFNFAGYSGKFAFDWDGNLVVSSDKKIRIEPIGLMPGALTFIQGWQVTGADGTVYRFEAREKTHMSSQSSPLYVCQHPFDNPPVSTWYLTKITSPNQDNIFFQYQEYQMQYNMRLSETTSHRDYMMPATTNFRTERMTVWGQYLKKIYTGSGDSLVFINSATSRTDVPGGSGSRLFSLGEIKAIAKNGATLKHLKLGYDNSVGRLTLKSIQELSVDGSNTLKPPHRFVYSGALPAFSADPMQPATFFSQDHWGYYNGNSKSMLTPSYRVIYDNGSQQIHEGGDRSPSAGRMKAGILTQIVYPTGGTTTFEYEPHSYGFVGATPLEEEELVEKDELTRRIASENTGPHREYTTEYFHVGDVSDEGVYVNIDMGYCSGPDDFASASLGPWVSLHKGSGELIQNWVLKSDSHEGYLHLPPGDYYFKVSTLGGQCANDGYDWASGSASWQEGTGVMKRIARTAGGLRVKKITDHDGLDHANDVIRKFDYTMSEPGQPQPVPSGVIFAEPEYEFRTLIHEGADDSYNPKPYMTRISNNCIALGSTQGSHIGYRQVNVLYGEGGEGGKTESTFSSIVEHPDDIEFEPPFPPASSFDFRRGLLKKQVDYKYEYGNYTPVKQIENDYDKPLSKQIPAYKVGFAVSGGGLFGETFLFRYNVGGYTINFGFPTLADTRETRFDGSNQFVTEQFSTYDAGRQFLTKQSVKMSDNTERITEYAYPFLFDNPANTVITEMKNRHMHSPVIETTIIEKSADGTQHVVDAAYTEFGLFGNRIFPSRQWQFKAERPASNFVRSYFNNGNPDLRYYREAIAFNRYNVWGKPEQVTKPGNDVSTFIWGYDGKLPIAQVSQADYWRCAFANFEQADHNNWLYNDQDVVATDWKTGVRSFRGMVTTLRLEPGVYRVSLWAKSTANNQVLVDGIPLTITSEWRRYEWTLSYPSFVTVNTNGNLIDDLRLHPVGAQMKTFTFFPRSVLSSVTDENHITTYYEYDGLTRLRTVRDNDGNIVKHHQYHYTGQ